MPLCIWDNGFRNTEPTRDQEHPIDATTCSHPDGIHIAFDDHRLVNECRADPTRHVGPATWACPNWSSSASTWAMPRVGRTTGDKMMTLVASALAGGDCIDDADVLRTGRTAGALGCVVKAPSTLGTFLRSFR